MGVGAGLTLPALYISLLAIESSGYGTFVLARLFFPYMMVRSALTGIANDALAIALAFLQLPVEGALIGLALTSKRPSLAWVVIAAHLAGFGVASWLGR